MIVFSTAIGRCAVTWGDAGITGIELLAHGARAADQSREDDAPASVRDAIAAMVALLDGDRAQNLREVELDERALDDFSRSVYASARAVGPGQTTTYGEIARTIGAPHAARAVGAALAGNPFVIVVPCHRVLAADGSLHGFSAPGGIETKRRMLELEGTPGFAQRTLFDVMSAGAAPAG